MKTNSQFFAKGALLFIFLISLIVVASMYSYVSNRTQRPGISRKEVKFVVPGAKETKEAKELQEAVESDAEEPQVTEIKEIPSEIVKDIALENSACRGEKTIVAEDYNFRAQSVDLNGDAAGEIIVDANSICEVDLTAANGENHFLYVYQKSNGAWTKIFDGGGSGVYVEDTKTDGYYDLNVWAWTGLVQITTSRTTYKWNKSASSYVEAISFSESDGEFAAKDSSVEDWNIYADYVHNFQISYPIGLSASAVKNPKDTVVIDLVSPSDPQAIIINYASQDVLNAMGISYCGAKPNDKDRCEPVIIDHRSFVIEKNSGLESVRIDLPAGGAVYVTLIDADAGAKNIYRQILSTFQFTK